MLGCAVDVTAGVVAFVVTLSAAVVTGVLVVAGAAVVF